jgi:hypothetical protein
MSGGVSHLESFDPKPALSKYAAMTIDESPVADAVLKSPFYRKNVRDFAGGPRKLMPKLYPMQVGYRPRGENGIEISDWWPQLGSMIDEIGFHAAEHRHDVTDLHATVLTQLGLNPRSLEVPGHKRLEIEFGKAIREIVA